MQNQEQKKGKFIVIDGTDGSGKTTQLSLLVERLKNLGHSVEIADFPQYNTKSAGLVEEYLSGKYGNADEVGPYRASIFYACDRYDASFKIRKWLDEGKIVISNRYVTANMGHQGGKIDGEKERKEYFDWLYKLEYEIFSIPRPDLNIILHVPAEISQRLSQQRTREDWKGKTNDIHQDDLAHLKKAESVYLEIANTFPNFYLIECTKNNEILSKEEINNTVFGLVIDLINPKNSLDSEHKFYAAKSFWEDALQNEKEEINIDPIKKDTEEIKIINELKIELIHPNAKLPTRSHPNDAGIDLYAYGNYCIPPSQRALISTGVKMAIPGGCAGLIWDKSGIAKAGLHSMAGVIDSDYRGEIIISLVNLGESMIYIESGQKIAQILIQKIEYPKITEKKLDDETSRGQGGFGSTGLF